MKFLKENWFKLGLLVFLFLIAYIFLKTNYSFKNELSRQDLVIKCEEIYKIKHANLEKTRYDGQEKSALIWSPKTKSCLAYYIVYSFSSPKYQVDGSSSLFEVWDYSNDDLVLSYLSYRSEKCMLNNLPTLYMNLLYKYDKKLEAVGCGLEMQDEGIDIITNFEKAMIEIGFKK